MPITTLSSFIEFPNLGWKFHISDSIHLFGDFSIRWYGLLIAIGFLLAIIYGLKRAESFGIDPDRMIDVALLTVPVAFIGARLYYVFFSDSLAEYLANPISIIKVWEGGLAIYGGIIVAFIFGPLMCKLRKVKIWAMFDLTALGFLIGQGIGRWGNFFNQEAFGGNTNLPWAMTGDVIQNGHLDLVYNHAEPVHPTFLYESLWCLLGFVLLHILSKRIVRRFDGMIFCGYMVWYGTGRFLIEGLRTDSLMVGILRVSQLIAIVAILLGIILFFILRRYSLSLPKTLFVAIKDGETGTEETDVNDAEESAAEPIEEATDGTAD
ncbi:MAG: prolipoprotein diacylglyceryl transferase [Clostridia bacterium]|nr:prolipoprotein diacylglyceryl transferase [Clostridia bacterium]